MDVRDLTLRACLALALWIKTGGTFVGTAYLPSRPGSISYTDSATLPRTSPPAAALMSSDPSPRGAAPAYDDAEKGVSDSVVVYPVDKKAAAFPVDEKNPVFIDEKKDGAPFQPPQVKRDPYALVKGAPKREASKWTVFKLWYNMYR